VPSLENTRASKGPFIPNTQYPIPNTQYPLSATRVRTSQSPVGTSGSQSCYLTWHVRIALTCHVMMTCHGLIRRRAPAGDSIRSCFRNTRSMACSSSKCSIYPPMPPLKVLG
jgi:hypothetical protein